MVLSYKKLAQDVYTIHRDSIKISRDLKTYGGRQKTKSRLECLHRKFGQKQKKGISCILLNPLVVCGVPDGI